jgi:hypothetical protein
VVGVGAALAPRPAEVLGRHPGPAATAEELVEVLLPEFCHLLLLLLQDLFERAAFLLAAA